MMPSRRIGRAFYRRRTEQGAALIVYVCAGDPSLDETERLVPQLVAAGADIIEIGVPFSDPIADGPVIEAAAVRALAGGTTLRRILGMVARLREGGLETPLLLMTYMNPLQRLGGLGVVAESGIDGLIVPDLPHDEAPPLRAEAEAAGLDLVGLAAPTTPPDRLRAIGASATGFVYYVSVTGVTGARADLPPDLPAQLAQARAASSVPVAVGFGIESPAQARALAPHADGIIVGSALIKALQGEGGIARGVALVRALKSALLQAPPIEPSSTKASPC
jgi:tryptophan synthase alpha chain